MITKEELELARDAANIEENINKKIIKGFIKGLTEHNILVSIDFQQSELRCSVEFYKEDGVNTYFASNFDFKIDREYHYNEDLERRYGDYRLSISHGSIGYYSRKEDPDQIWRLELMTTLWQHENELVNLYLGLNNSKQKFYSELNRQYDKEQYAIEQEAHNKLEEEVKSKIKVGYTFEETKDNENTYSYKITKITPKRVYVDYSIFQPNCSDGFTWNENREIAGYKYHDVKTYCSGYIDYERLVNTFVGQIEHNDYNHKNWYLVCDCIKADKYIRTEYSNERETSAEE